MQESLEVILEITPDNDPKVLRRERRFKASELPAELRTVVVYLHGDELDAQVVNASRSGFGFRLAAPVNHLVQGIRLSLLFPSMERRLTGTVAFLEKETEGSCRVGVRLEESLAHEAYAKMVAQLEK